MKLAHAGNSLKAAIIVVLIAIVCLPSQVSAAGFRLLVFLPPLRL